MFLICHFVSLSCHTNNLVSTLEINKTVRYTTVEIKTEGHYV
uniref:Uncharacterized protein n=1 Tax=Escherichia phage PMBT16 TaxID=3137282 RepID=A0AAU8BUM6_9VIRU